MNMASQVVLAALRVHPTRSVSRIELSVLAGCSERDVRTAISELRRQGWLVVGDAEGYWIAQNADEVHQVLRALECRIESLQEVIAAMRAASYLRFDGCTQGVQSNAPTGSIEHPYR